MSMRIAIDLRFLHIGLGREYPFKGAIGGIGRVQLEQLKLLFDYRNEFELVLLGVESYPKKILTDLFSGTVKDSVVLLPRAWHHLPLKLNVISEWIRRNDYSTYCRLVSGKNVDIVHTHGDTWHVENTNNSYKTIVTVHDHLYSKNHSNFRQKISELSNNEINYLNKLRTVSHLVTVSDSIKDALLEDYNFLPNKVSTVPNGLNTEIFNSNPTYENEKKKLKDKYSIDKPYFIYSGSWFKKKNVSQIIRVFEEFSKVTGKDVSLILVGNLEKYAKEETCSIRKQISDSPYAYRIKELSYLSDNELAMLNRNAEAFIHLSFYEGFGLGVVEAMSCGIPVVASSGVASLLNTEMEVELVDPSDLNMTLHKMIQVTSDSDFRKKMILKQNRVISELTWKRSVLKLVEIYRKVGQEK